MPEIGASGSVGGRDGNIPTYPASSDHAARMRRREIVQSRAEGGVCVADLSEEFPHARYLPTQYSVIQARRGKPNNLSPGAKSITRAADVSPYPAQSGRRCWRVSRPRVNVAQRLAVRPLPSNSVLRTPATAIEPVRNFERIVQILTELDRDNRLTADQKP
jgi:hypothetical protein